MAWQVAIPLVLQGLQTISSMGDNSAQIYANKQAELAKADLEFRKAAWEDQKRMIDEANALTKGAYNYAVKQYEKSALERAEYIGKTEALLGEPTQKYDQRRVDANLALVKTNADRVLSEQRPKVLDNLSTRGVRTSGISEAALAPINKQYTQSLTEGAQKYTIEELLAERTAAQNRYNQKLQFNTGFTGRLGATPQPGSFGNYSNPPESSDYLAAQYNQAYAPFYKKDVVNTNLSNFGSGLARLADGNSYSNPNTRVTDGYYIDENGNIRYY